MIDIIDLSVQFSGDNLFENVTLRINNDDKIALVGANGTGKSTFLKLLNNNLQPETGNISKPKNLRIGYLPQEIVSKHGRNLFNEVKNSLSFISDIVNSEDKVNSKLHDSSVSEDEKEKLIVQLGEINHIKEQMGFYSIDSEIEKVLVGLGFAEEDFSRLTDEFSGGWQMRIELAKILLSQNDLILLDEPTNHLDIDSLQWLVDYLTSYKGAILLVSHDKYFVNHITTKTLEIFNKKLSYFKGKYDDFLKFKVERDLQLEAQYKNQQQKIKETERFIERFRAKNTKAKQVQSRVKQLEKLERVELAEKDNQKISIRFPEPPRSGVIPVELRKICKSYDENHVLENIDLKIERGEKMAFLGPNGAGKTTLSRIIAGNLLPTKGEVIIGHNTEVSYYAQEVADNLDIEKDALETVSSISHEYTEGQLRSVLGSFLFSNDDVYKKVKVLSGGEKSRLALAKIMLTKANVIVLDEPTNHLDITSKEILQKALIDFSGTLIIVSHDIDFIRPIVDKVIEIRKNHIQYYYGDIDYYIMKREALLKGNIPENEPKEAEEDKPNKKDQKRFEAELRQKKYQATKTIKTEIESLEIKIEEFEELKLKYESELSDEKIYQDAAKMRETTLAYDNAKANLDAAMEKWTELSMELEEIENSFE